MDIHEYQAKELLVGFGVPVPKGGVAYSAEQAVYRAAEIGGERWVVKAQVHSGARGKAGGVLICSSDAEVRQAAKDLLGKTLVTFQTGPEGLPVHRLLVEQALPIERELYVGLVLDRKRERIVVVAHPASSRSGSSSPLHRSTRLSRSFWAPTGRSGSSTPPWSRSTRSSSPRTARFSPST